MTDDFSDKEILVIGMVAGLDALFGSNRAAAAWLAKDRMELDGKSPLEHMLSCNIQAFRDVMDLLDNARGPMTDYSEIIARLESLDGSDRDVDKAICIHVSGWVPVGRDTSPKFTSSIDAALTLVPEGLEWDVSSHGLRADGGVGSLASVHAGPMVIGRAANPAIALCIAALKARQETEG